ncbi:DUF1080 domain-containing protein [Mariniflexile sp. AS56]|uniref:3-keto-disaccharide hydrolase n=1 Tax=Mariniflexile sp. AS56 TaxID=3063957 RepID=UPI0026EC43B8|nr:DUF1080 domain-containing protein [Mariniflexile sp. AS56]MDO7172496.1 DUF1080 domain-containing protein [Mariniflexile sp. AS56]
MKFLKIHQIRLLLMCLATFNLSMAQEAELSNLSLNDLNAFDSPGENWEITSAFISDFAKPWGIKKLDKGSGVLVNNLTKVHRSHLITKKEFGDIYLELDFMMDKGSNAGVYLQGRYEIQLLDSWRKEDPIFSDCGGIYQRWNSTAEVKGFEGVAPLQNATRAPGLWQQLRIRFRAPRFNSDGKKIANARFEEVYLNDVLVQQQVEVLGPTRSAKFGDEKSMGPLMIQGDHGKLAIRNIKYSDFTYDVPSNNKRANGLIILNPDKKPYLLRSFLDYQGEKLNYVVSIGTHEGIHYSYDVSQGSLLQVWRGRFMDVTDMWHSRGISQVAMPLGSVVPLFRGPSIAYLSNKDAEWPENVNLEDMHDTSYILDQKGIPTFKYKLKGVSVRDKIELENNGESLRRNLAIENSTENLYCRVISAKQLELVSKNLYRVNGMYYVRLNQNSSPIIRETAKGQEMLLTLGKYEKSFSYSIIW